MSYHSEGPYDAAHQQARERAFASAAMHGVLAPRVPADSAGAEMAVGHGAGSRNGTSAASGSASASLSPANFGDLPVHTSREHREQQHARSEHVVSTGVSSISHDLVANYENQHPGGLPTHAPLKTSPNSSSADIRASSAAQASVKKATGTPALARPAGVQQQARRRRKRTCLSCQRCHQLKVKCDKELPCARCVASDKGASCYYNYNKGIHSGKFASMAPPPDLPHEDPKAMMTLWQIHHRTRGGSHWRDLMLKITKTVGPEKSSPLEMILQNITTNACLSNFSLPGNFPFGTPGASKYYSRDAVIRLIDEEADNVALYIDTYVELVDAINPVIDVDTFQDELEKYSNNPGSVSLCWMSILLMVLGLGSFVSSDPEPAVATEFMLAAEACLMQTPFMFRPTLSNLKALTLMVEAKQFCNATCWAVDSAWSLHGLLVRTAYTFGLPQEYYEAELTAKEKQDRRHLWLTIRYIEAKVTINAGMPPVSRHEDAVDVALDISNPRAPENMHDVLHQAFPTVKFVVANMNNSTDQIDYADALKHGGILRSLITHARRVCSSELQFTMLDIFLRRCVMVLHRPFALHDDGPTLYTESYWTSLECALAVLIHYREIYAGGDETPPGYPVVGRANTLDWMPAVLTVCLYIMRRELPLTDVRSGGALRGNSGLPPRQLILETVHSCIHIWEGEKDRSVCYRTAYHLLVVIQAMLPQS